MGRATTKLDMTTAAISNYEKLNVLISKLTEEELSTLFDFTADDKKEEAHWKTIKAMNVGFWEMHQNTPLEEAKEMLKKSHEEVLSLAETFSNEELFSKGTYKWVGGSTLGSYFVSATASHYDWAMKKLKAHKKNCFI